MCSAKVKLLQSAFPDRRNTKTLIIAHKKTKNTNKDNYTLHERRTEERRTEARRTKRKNKQMTRFQKQNITIPDQH